MPDNWSFGCRAYAFGRQRQRRAAERGTYNWLTVLDESDRFVFLNEDVPVRFYRGSADEPTNRTLRRQAVEAQQLALALGEEGRDPGLPICARGLGYRRRRACRLPGPALGRGTGRMLLASAARRAIHWSIRPGADPAAPAW